MRAEDLRSQLAQMPPTAYAQELTAKTKTAKVTAGLETDPLLKAGGRH
jgi:hypothetical protein